MARCRFCGSPDDRPSLLEHWPADHAFTFEACCEERQNELLGELERGEWPNEAIAAWLVQQGVPARSVGTTAIGANFSIDYGISIVPSTTLRARALGLAPPGALVRPEIFAYVRDRHRHAGERMPAGYLWAYAVYNGPTLIGVATVGRLASRELERWYRENGVFPVCDVTRVALDHRLERHLTWKAASMIYQAAEAEARARGYHLIVTYLLANEGGMSLRYARWKPMALGKGGQWDREARPRAVRSGVLEFPKVRWGVWLRPVPPGIAEHVAAQAQVARDYMRATQPQAAHEP